MNSETIESAKSTVVHLKDKELVNQICARARSAVLTWIRSRSQFVFWHPEADESFTPYFLGRFLGYGRKEKIDFNSVAKVLAHFSPMKFRNFEVDWSAGGQYYPRMTIRLKHSSEWTAVLEEAWEGLERPSHGLSEPADRLLQWANHDQHQNQWVDKSTIGRQAQLRGTSWTANFMATHIKEIQAKANIGFQFEQKEDSFRLSFESPKSAPEDKRHGPINPVLNIDFKKEDYSHLNSFRETLYDWILGVELPADNVKLIIWRIHDRATLLRCFPSWESENWEASTIYGFLGAVALDHGLLWGYSFKDPDPWIYECAPKDGWTWEKVIASIRAARNMPPLHEQYGISLEAAALMKWFTTLRQNEWLGALTPPVEDNLEKRIGIAGDHWDRDNFGVYLSMLADELSERTEWKVSVHPWKGGWHGASHRLLVKRKETDLDQIVTSVQALGLREGKLLSSDKIRPTLSSLLMEIPHLTEKRSL